MRVHLLEYGAFSSAMDLYCAYAAKREDRMKTHEALLHAKLAFRQAAEMLYVTRMRKRDWVWLMRIFFRICAIYGISAE